MNGTTSPGGLTLEDYIAALYDGDGRLIGPGQTAAVLRRAREDESLSVTDFKKICGAAYGLMKPERKERDP